MCVPVSPSEGWEYVTERKHVHKNDSDLKKPRERCALQIVPLAWNSDTTSNAEIASENLQDKFCYSFRSDSRCSQDWTL